MRLETGMERAACVAALAFVAVLQIHRLDDSDTWWHLAAGRHIVTSGGIPATDTFSYTAAGEPWINRQWLFEVGLFEAWRAFGDAGPALFAGAFFFAAMAFLLALARRTMPGWAAAFAVGVATCAALERFTVRPEAATLFFLALYAYVLAQTLTWRRVAVLVVLQVLWANMHALSILGFVPAAAALGAALVGQRPDRRPIVALAGGFALAEVATPFGLDGALLPVFLLSLISGTQRISYAIVEHRPTLDSLSVMSPVVVWAWAMLVAAAGGTAVAAIRRRAVQPLLAAIVFVGLGFLARRNVALVGLGVVPLVATITGPWLQRSRRGVRATLGAVVTLAFTVAAAGVVHGDLYQRANLTRTFGLGASELLFPRAAVEHLLRLAPSARLFNDDGLGGFVTWQSGGEMRVFFDGRLQVYPPAIYGAYQDVLDDPRRFAALARVWDFDAVLLQHPAAGRLELAAQVARLPGWKVTHLDAGGIVLLLTDDAPGQPEGLQSPVITARTDGIADMLEAAVTPLRGGWEEATAWYQRGRAVHFLYGPPGYRLARRDFTESLRWRPDFEAARIGLAASPEPR